jgi:hypothetical protein
MQDSKFIRGFIFSLILENITEIDHRDQKTRRKIHAIYNYLDEFPVKYKFIFQASNNGAYDNFRNSLLSQVLTIVDVKSHFDGSTYFSLVNDKTYAKANLDMDYTPEEKVLLQYLVGIYRDTE